MADLQAIRRGLAAQLRTVLPATEGHVRVYWEDTPPTPCLQVVGVDEMERNDFADGKRFQIVVEGVMGEIVSRSSHALLDEWLESNAVDGALEDDQGPNGALTKRLLDDGTVQAGQAPAADSVAFVRYGGSGRIVRGQTPLLVATWFFEVIT